MPHIFFLSKPQLQNWTQVDLHLQLQYTQSWPLPHPLINHLHCRNEASTRLVFSNHICATKARRLPQQPPCACHPVGDLTHLPLSYSFCWHRTRPRTETIIPAQCAVWRNQKCTIDLLYHCIGWHVELEFHLHFLVKVNKIELMTWLKWEELLHATFMNL